MFLGKAKMEGGLFINPIIYSELATQMESKEKLEEFLKDTGIEVENVEKQAAFEAGEKFEEYLKNRGDKFQCPKCGEKNSINCEKCKKKMSYRQHIAPDFMIGSHAKNQADQLLSFDKGFFRNYFSGLKLNALNSQNE